MIIYSASDLGSCIRSQVAARLGKEPLEASDATKEVWAAGHEWEKKVLDEMAANGWIFQVNDPHQCQFRPTWTECTQIEATMGVTGQIVVGCHLDGYGRYTNHNFDTVIEVKSCSNNQFELVKKKKWDVGGYFEKYKWQVSAQQLASGCLVLVVVVNKETGERVTLHHEQPFYTKEQISQRVLTVESWVRRGKLPNCDVTQYPCPFVYLGCTGDDDRVKASEEIERLAIAYKRAKVEEDQAGKEVTRLRQELKKACGTTKKLGSERVKITWYMQRNPPRLDRAKVEELGLDLDSLMTQGESERVRVDVKED